MGKKRKKVVELQDPSIDTNVTTHMLRAMGVYNELTNPDFLVDLLKFPQSKGLTECIRIAQPMCAPSRFQAMKVLSPAIGFIENKNYVIKSYSESLTGRGVDGATFACGTVVLRNLVEVWCAPQRAIWTEYNLLRSGVFNLRSRPHHPDVFEWASKWAGKPITPWGSEPLTGWAAQPDCAGAKLVPKDGKEPKGWKEPKPQKQGKGQAKGKRKQGFVGALFGIK